MRPPPQRGRRVAQSVSRSLRCRTTVETTHPLMGATLLPQLSAAAELLVVDLVAPHDPEPNPEFASHGDLCLSPALSAPVCAGRSVSRPGPGAPHGSPPRPRESAAERCLACSGHHIAAGRRRSVHTGSIPHNWPPLCHRRTASVRPRTLRCPCC